MNETLLSDIVEMARGITKRSDKEKLNEEDLLFIETLFSTVAVQYATSVAGSKTSALKKITSAQNGAKGGRKKLSEREKIMIWKDVDDEGIVKTKIGSFQKTYSVTVEAWTKKSAGDINEKTNAIVKKILNTDLKVSLYWEVRKFGNIKDAMYYLTIVKKFRGKEENEYLKFKQEIQILENEYRKIEDFIALSKKSTIKYLNTSVYPNTREEKLVYFQNEKPISIEPKFIIAGKYQCFLSIKTLPEKTYPIMLGHIIENCNGDFRCVMMYDIHSKMEKGEGTLTFQLWSENENVVRNNSFQMKKKLEKEGFSVKENTFYKYFEWKGMFPGNLKENARRFPLELINFAHLCGW